VELDDLMDGAPIQHRECMEHESTAFAELFPAGVRYLEVGGSLCGVEREMESNLTHYRDHLTSLESESSKVSSRGRRS
jgi:hypothetical protein